MRYTEFSLIEHIKNSFASIVPHGVCGIGDDCAVEPLDEKNSLITTTDMLVEDVHFLRSKISAFSLGRKAVAVNLSDVAAMGGHPKTLFLSLALPQNTDPIWLDDFILGMRSWGVPLLGGDTTKSLNSLIINIVVQGIVPTTNLKLRSGAKVGDTIFVSDTLGKSAAGLLVIQSEGLDSKEYELLVEAHNNPHPCMAQGEWLGAQQGVHAMMDISDGVASDLRHILKASSVGAQVDINMIPLSEELLKACAQNNWDTMQLALGGGEDFALLLTAENTVAEHYRHHFGTELYPIGTITKGSELQWINGLGRDFRGYSHF